MEAGAFVNLNSMTPYSNSMPGEKRDFVLVIFIELDEVIGILEVLLSTSEIGRRGHWFFTGALLRGQ
jgi:hypothetical protein